MAVANACLCAGDGGILRETLKTCYLHRRSIIVIKRHIRFQTCLHKQQPIIRIYKGIIHEKNTSLAG